MFGVATLVLGWALGLLTSPISEHLRDRWAKPRLLRALRTDLTALLDTIATAAVSIQSRHQALTHGFLRELRALLGTIESQRLYEFSLKTIDGFLEISEADLAREFARRAANPRLSASVRTYRLRYVETQLPKLELLDPEVHGAILRVLQRLDLFNQLTEEVTRYHFMTFDPGENFDAITENWRTLSTKAGEHAILLAKELAALLAMPEMQVLSAVQVGPGSAHRPSAG